MAYGGKDQGGYVLVVLAFVIVILLGFAALAVDLGVMYAAHTSAQRAADAAALAGAYTFIENPTLDAANQKLLAETRATTTATQNTILGATIQSAELTPAPYADVANRRVTVNLSHTIPTFFAGVLGPKFATVSVVAYAEAAGNANCTNCVKPWFIPNNILSTLGCNACQTQPGDPSPQLLVLDDPNNPTQWAKNYIAQQVPPPSGSGFTVKPGNPANALGPGDFFAIVLPNDVASDTGGDVYRENIAECNPGASNIQCGNLYYVKPGNMIGPTTQGTSLFVSFGITDKSNQLDPYKDTWVNGIPTFQGPSTPLPPAVSGQWGSSHQEVVAPIWDVCSTICKDCPSGPDCGKLPGNGSNTQIQVIGFAHLFISDVQANDVKAYLVWASACGQNPAPCGGSSVKGYPLRLVRMN